MLNLMISNLANYFYTHLASGETKTPKWWEVVHLFISLARKWGTEVFSSSLLRCSTLKRGASRGHSLLADSSPRRLAKDRWKRHIKRRG